MTPEPPIIIIAAMGRSRVIGSGEGMPWNVPDEYAQFLSFITDQTVIMGRRSWQIFGPDLTSAHNVVVSRSMPEVATAQVAPDPQSALSLARSFGLDVYVAGGGQLYRALLPDADRMYLSTIHGDFSGDTYFPEFREAEWHVARRDQHPEFEFVEYHRVRASDG